MQAATTTEVPAKKRPMALQKVPLEHAARVLPHVIGRLQAVVDRSGERYTVASLAELVMRGEFQLWVIGDEQIRGVVLTELFFAPSGKKVASIRAATGDAAEGWLHLLPELEQWAKSEGCHVVEAIARKGWARRLTDYKLTHVVLEKELA